MENKNFDIITSRQNPLISSLSKLSDKKYRDREELFLLDGIKLTLEAAADRDLETAYVIIREDAVSDYYDCVKNALPSAKICVTASSVFERITDEKAPQGVVSAVKYSETVKRELAENDSLPSDVSLILDGVQNPDNFGAMLRSARAFGAHGVICGGGCADIYSRRVMRASMGAALHIGTSYTDDLPAVCRKMAGEARRVIATIPHENASSLFDFRFREGDAIVIGNEGHGISDAVIDAATDMLYIPMVKDQESLNASVATAVILYEMYRQRSQNIL